MNVHWHSIELASVGNHDAKGARWNCMIIHPLFKTDVFLKLIY
jgi:hypothetical protein